MFFKNFEKMQAISPYWFAAMTGSGQKMAKTKTFPKTTYMWYSGSKG